MVKARPIAPRFCSMYGDVLLHLVEQAGLAMRAQFKHGGARVGVARPIVSRFYLVNRRTRARSSSYYPKATMGIEFICSEVPFMEGP